MREDNVISFRTPGTLDDALTELLRNGAKQLIQQAIEAELAELLEEHADRRDERGRAAVVRNGHLP
ncbi:MAG: IS256 family transposase, partial [Methylococcales bacterium]